MNNLYTIDHLSNTAPETIVMCPTTLLFMEIKTGVLYFFLVPVQLTINNMITILLKKEHKHFISINLLENHEIVKQSVDLRFLR